MPPLVLASTSPFRRRMLEDAGFTLRLAAPGVDESAWRDDDPSRLAQLLATAKADAIELRPGETGVAADQVAWDPETGEMFGKPPSARHHLDRLMSLRGRHHELHTGYCVWNAERRIVGCEVVRVHVRAGLTREEIQAYVDTGDGAGCAAGYTAEGLGSFMIERIEGDWFTVIGLPLYQVHGALRELARG